MKSVKKNWKIIHEVKVYDYDGEINSAPLGKILRSVVFSKSGSNIHRLILQDKELKAAIKDVTLTIRKCKKQKEKNECKKNAEEKLEILKKLVKEKGFYYNEDIFDIFFDDINVLNK